MTEYFSHISPILRLEIINRWHQQLIFPNVAQGPVVLRHPRATLRIIDPGLLLRICHFKVQALQISKLFDYLACWAKFTFVSERKFLVYILMIKTRVFAEIKYIYTLGNFLEVFFLKIYVAVTCLSVLHWFEFEAAEDCDEGEWRMHETRMRQHPDMRAKTPNRRSCGQMEQGHRWPQ